MSNDPNYKKHSAKTGKDILNLLRTKGNSRNGAPEVQPIGEVQAILADIWSVVLSTRAFSINDDFFKAGGNSIKAVQLASKLAGRFKVSVQLTDIFLNPTIPAQELFLSQKTASTNVHSGFKILPRPARIPLSFSQERLWVVHQLEGSVQYHTPLIFNLQGHLNILALEKALQQIINRHEVLRTVIKEEEGKPYQEIISAANWHLPVFNLHQSQPPVNEEDVLNELISAPFALDKDFMLRASLLNKAQNNYTLAIVIHHIVSDGWSMSIIAKELVELYDHYNNNGEGTMLPGLAIQYADYAVWQRNVLVEDSLDKKLEFWKKNLADVKPLDLPIDRQRPLVLGSRGAGVTFQVKEEIMNALVQLSHLHETTLFNTLLAAFKVLMYRYTGQPDICVGTAVANRQDVQFESLVGFFVNTLPLRSFINEDDTFIDLLKKIKEETLLAFQYQDVPFEKIVDAVIKERDVSRTPLVQAMFVLQNTPPIPSLNSDGFNITQVPFTQHTSKFEITFTLEETAGGLNGSIEYNTDLFTASTIERFADHFINLVTSIVKDPAELVAVLPIISGNERQQLIYGFNKTAEDLGPATTLHGLFEQQAALTPNAIAVAFHNVELTYSSLNEKANKIAHQILSNNVSTETIIPICLERSVEMIAGILGILKAGCAYVPIDPEYPADRIQYILDDTQAAFMLCSKAVEHKLKLVTHTRLLVIDALGEEQSHLSITNPGLTVQPSNLAYVIYTSGTSGKPKGAMNEHAGVVNRILWAKKKFNVGTQDAVLQKTTFCFDVSVWELLGPLCAGAKLVFATPGLQGDSNYLRSIISQQSITIIHFVPSMLQAFLADLQPGDCTALKIVLCSGEALKPSLVNQFISKLPEVQLHNLYGPTEAAVEVSCWSLPKTAAVVSQVPIGKPIANTQLFVLDKRANPLPVGIAGELLIGGIQVGRGYLNKPGLTAEKFILNPFSTDKKSRLYKTGDVARWLPDGNIEYLGRSDDQVKIRGFRIELSEIENVLMDSGMVSQAVVLAKEDRAGTKRLVGYVLKGSGYAKDKIVAYLESKLPVYMIPVLWVEMDQMPLLENGKVSKKALPEPLGPVNAARQVILPKTELQQALAQIWQELLHHDEVSIDDNFFELGGDSILSIQAVSRINRLGYSVQPKDIFLYQTIGKLSDAISRRSHPHNVSAQNTLTGPAGLLPVQQWYLQKHQPDVSHFNQSVLFSIDKTVSIQNLDEAIKVLVQHHDALRFRYNYINDCWQQQYGSTGAAVIVEDLSNNTQNFEQKLNAASTNHQQSLDIEKGELIRVILFKTPSFEKANRLLIIIHHLAVDGVSWRILAEDLKSILNALVSGQSASLGFKTSAYADWYLALEKYGQSNLVSKQLPYWQKTVSSYQPLPTDFIYNDEVLVKHTSVIEVEFDNGTTTSLLKEAGRAYKTDVVDLLLAALVKTICDYGNTDNVVIGMEGHGREHISDDVDTSRTVGWFTSLYPLLLTHSSNDAGFIIRETKEQLRSVPGKGLGYGILKYINKAPGLTGEARWDILFNYLGQVDVENGGDQLLSVAGNGLQASRSERHRLDEKISIGARVEKGQLRMLWQYSNVHFSTNTVSSLTSNFKQNLEMLVLHCVHQQDVQYTPSDFLLGADVSINDLDQFLGEDYKGRERRTQVENIYKLNALQQGLLFHGLYSNRAEAYIQQFACDILHADVDLVKQSWQLLTNRHSILRTAFYAEALPVPVQCVYNKVELPFYEFDFRDKELTQQQAAVAAFEAADRARGFQFEEAPLMRLSMLRLTDEKFRLVWTYHHILLDGWSMPVLMQEFLHNYRELSAGLIQSAQPEDKFEDYIQFLSGLDEEQDEKYWRVYLQNIEQGTLLPFIQSTVDRNKAAGQIQHIQLHFDTAFREKLSGFAKEHKLTVNTILQGVWAYLLHTYTGNEHIVFGNVVSGRPAQLHAVDQRVGMYINTLPHVSVLSNGQTIAEWLQKLQQNQAESRQHQYTPLHHIQQLSGIKGDLFDTLFVYENYPAGDLTTTEKGGLQVSNISLTEQTNYPLTITVDGNSYEPKFSFNTALLNNSQVQQVSAHFNHVLQQVVSASGASVYSLEVITNEERLQIDHFNQSLFPLPPFKSIVDLFQQQAQKTPAAVALICNDQQITYQQLDLRTSQLASLLIEEGVLPGMPVPVCIERSIDLVVGMLAILKAGGAYVPIDPAYPHDRIQYMLSDTKAAVVLTSTISKAALPAMAGVRVINMNNLGTERTLSLPGNFGGQIEAGQLAYIIYTSGSTGQPKGVMIEHQNLFAFINWCHTEFASSHFETVYASTSICFDLSVFEIFFPLTVGKKIRIIENGLQIASLLEYDEKVMINTVPMVVEHLLKEGSDLANVTVINMAGEPIPRHVADGLDTDTIEVRNLYGPSEDTTYSTCYHLLNGGPILIGKPIAHSQVHITSRFNKLLPVGIAGEICLAGAGLARGYWNNKALTDEKFVPNIFSPNNNERLYKTGDVGRWLPNGNIEYLGRLDSQAKIRGFRIEPGEIEAVTARHPSVMQVIVTVKKDNGGNNYLVAYVVASPAFSREEIVAYLETTLPGYMVPQTWVRLDSFPYTVNGKIDKKNLPDPSIATMQEFYQPVNETEEALVQIWQSLLGASQVSTKHNFFELGGHSILAMRMVSAISKQMQRKISVKDVFVYTTIQSLAKFIDGGDKAETLPRILLQPRPKHIPLSFSQERLWFIHQFEGSIQYHMPGVYKIDGPLNIEALNDAFKLMVKRHEILRTVYVEEGGIPFQQVNSFEQWKLAYNSVAGISNSDMQALLENDIYKPFNLTCDYMLRASLFAQATDKHLLAVTMHHIAADGWSLSILMKEVLEIYGAIVEDNLPTLPALPLQFADFAIWQRNVFTGELLEKEVEFWQQYLAGVAPLKLPSDLSSLQVRSAESAVEHFKIETGLAGKLKDLSHQHSATLFMTMLAAYKVLLYRYTHQNDVCIGIPVAGRNQQEVENLVGFFVNTLAIRTNVEAETTFSQLLQVVKEHTLNAYVHQDVPFEKIVETVAKERDLGTSPLFQVMFTLENQAPQNNYQLNNLNVTSLPQQQAIAKFDLTFSLFEDADGIQGTVEYKKGKFSDRFTKRMISHYHQLLVSIQANPLQTIGRLNLLTGQEKEALLNRTTDAGLSTIEGNTATVLSLFGQQVKSNPTATALYYGKQQVTYQQLNERSNKVANFLHSKGLEKESLVPVCIERSIDLVTCLLGIMKAGCAYVPIDPAYPEERVNYMVKDAGAKLVLTNSNNKSKLQSEAAINIIEVDNGWHEIERLPGEDVTEKAGAGNLAYVIYTSGSTGLPKGVMIEHKGLSNLVNWHNTAFGVSSDSCATAMAGVGFDAFGWEIFPYLCKGASVILVDEETRLSLPALAKLINDYQVSHSFIATAVLNDFINDFGKNTSTLKYVLTGGDRLAGVDTSHLPFTVVNNYGPTEYSVVATSYTLPAASSITAPPIGVPILNTRIYILDEHQQLLPEGIFGEICIGGAGIARGYHNRAELTSQKFISNPFNDGGADTIYRTGDLGRWLPDGTIEYGGRLDNQVKLRGYRIELGEIESVFIQTGRVKQVVVVAKKDEQEQGLLLAYLVPGEHFNEEEIRATLQSRLPAYMVPARWIILDALPLTPNGKIDTKALPEVVLSNTALTPYAAPEDDIQKKLVNTWQQLLKLDKIGIDDNFFELGGHSLLAMRLLAILQKEFKLEIEVKELFEYTTIRQLAKYLHENLALQQSDVNDFDVMVI